MITSKNRIHRRTVLRGAGGIAIGLPFLDAMIRPLRTHAAETTPMRFVVFYSPGGTLLDKWRPTGTTTNYSLQSMMSPLTPMKDRLIFVDGVDMKVTQMGYGHPHSRGMGGMLTGQPLLAGTFNTNGGNAGFASGISIDQALAAQLSAGLRLKSLEVSSGWSTGITAGGQPHPGSIINYAGSNMPIPPAADPLDTFNRVFSAAGGDGQAQIDWDTSILDSVMEDYRYFSGKLGPQDKVKLDAHLQMINEAEQGLKVAIKTTCVPPTTVNKTPGYYTDGSNDAVRGGDDGPMGAISTGVKVPEKGHVMTDILVSAMACDITRVGTMQYSDSEAKFMLTFLKAKDGKALSDHHHGYQHDRGFQPEALEIIYNWYASNFLYLLQKMDEVKDANGMSMLDNSLVLWGSEIQEPASHGQNNMPFVIAGKLGGKLKAGQWLKVQSQPHNNMLVSILNLFGMPTTKFGHANYNTGALAGLG